MADGLSQWWDEDAERLNKMAAAARKIAVKVPHLEDATESRSGDCTRDPSGRFGEGNQCQEGAGSGSGESSGAPRTARGGGNSDILAKLIEKISSNPDGFTLDPLSAETPPDGIMVSEFPNDTLRSATIKVDQIKTADGMERLSRWYADNADLLVGQSDRYIGGWRQGDEFYLDVATRFPPEKAAESLERGRKAGQYAVFNLGTFKETYVQYDADDKNKPKDLDKKLAKLRLESQVKQVYDDKTPDLQEEDWADELAKHGRTTVRSYNGEPGKEPQHGRSGSAVRHQEQADDHRGLPRDEGVLRAGRGIERREARSCLVRRQPGVAPVPVQGSARSPQKEAREVGDCGRLPGGIFGHGNKCQAEGDQPTDAFGGSLDVKSHGGGASTKVPKADTSWKKSEGPVVLDSDQIAASPPARSLAGVSSISIPSGKTLSDSLKATGVTLDQAARACSTLGDGSTVTIAHGTFDEVMEYMDAAGQGDTSGVFEPLPGVTFVSRREISGAGGVSASVSLSRDEDDDLTLSYNFFTVDPEVQKNSPVMVARELYRSVSSSITEAERIGVTRVDMLAAGDADDKDMKGYRIWPRLGFDGVIPRAAITPKYSLRLGFFEPYGSNIPDAILSDRARAEKNAGSLTIQSLYDTPEGQMWWEQNGSTMPMSLDVGDEDSAGWQRFTRVRDRFSKRSIDGILEAIDAEWRSIRVGVERRSEDCNREPDGKFGKDNDCQKEGGGVATAEPSNNRVRIGDSEEVLNSRLGNMSLSMDQVVGMAGGGRDDADVYVRRSYDDNGIRVQRTLDIGDVEGGMESITIVRNEGTKENPEIVVHHDLLEVSDDVKQDPAKRHAAARECFKMMADSVTQAQKHGVSKITFNAAGSLKDDRFKGYTIWPRMGFDAPIPFDLRKKLPEGLSKARTLLDLHSTPEGTRWWRDNGVAIDVSLDLNTPDSPQMKVFDRFKKRFAAEDRSGKSKSVGSGWLSTEDEAKFDEIWKEIWDKAESRGFCATGIGGGIDNSCGSKEKMAPDDGSGGGGGVPPVSTVKPPPPPSISVESKENLDKDMKAIGASSVDDIVSLGGGNLRGASVSIRPSGSGRIGVAVSAPVERDGSSAENFNMTVTINSGDDGKELHLETFGMAGSYGSSMSRSNDQRVMSLVSEKLIESIMTAEKLDFDRVTTWAIGDAQDAYKGYRLWPQFGMDGPIPDAALKKIPDELVLKAKGIEIPRPGATSIPHHVVLRGLAQRHRRGLTIQELISTREGDRWWDRNGMEINLTLNLRDKTSLGYKKWEEKKAKLPTLKKRNETRGFCPTGEGGGIDNSCGRESAGDDSPTDAFGSKLGGFQKKGGAKGGTGKAPVAQVDRPAGAPVANVTSVIVASPPTQRSEDGKRIVSSTIAGPEDIFEMAGREFFTTVAVGRSLTEQQSVDRGGVTIDSSQPLTGANREYVVDSHVQQVEAAQSRGLRPIFYTDDERQQQIDEYSVMEPRILGGRTSQGVEVTPENAEFLLRAVQAITSSNASPEQNMKRTQAVLDKFFSDDGRIATSTSFGVTGAAIGKSLSRMQKIIDRLGERPDGSIDTEAGLARARELFVGKTMRVGDIDEFVRDLVGGDKGDWKPSSYLVDQEVPVFSVFGPKFGPFFANNNGDLDHLTADIWATRTFGRVTGELVLESKPEKHKGYAKDTLKVLKSATSEMLHGYDGDQLVAGLQKAAATGEVDDVVRGWAAERLRHYARGDYTEKRGTGGKLNKLAKNIVDNDVSLMGDPGSGTRRANMIDVYREVSRRTGLAVANAQDVLWQDEQDAYAAAGAKTVTAVGTPSFYSDVIREIARDPSNRFPRATREGQKPKKGRAKKERRSFIEQDFGSYDDFDRGGRENLLYWEALADVSDDDFADKVIALAEGGRRTSRRSLSVAQNTVVERRSMGQTTVTMPKAGLDGLHVMGFDAQIPSDLVEKLPETLSHCRTLLDLHVSDGGEAWWSQNGRKIDVSIDLEGPQGRVFDEFSAGKTFSDILDEGILDDYGCS